MSAKFGTTAWGRAWVRRIEPILVAVPDRALVRARSLSQRATSDPVVEGGTVRATVSERGREHEVVLQVPRWEPEQEEAVREILGGYAAHELDDLPDRAFEQLVAAGVEVAPEVEAVTSPGTTRRAHRLAVLYRLSQLVDEEPHVAIRLRTPREDVAPAPGDPEDGMDVLPLGEIDPTTFYEPVRGG